MILNYYYFLSTCWVLFSECIFYPFYDNKNKFILSLGKKLSKINIIYVKVLQAISADHNLIDDEAKKILIEFYR